MERNETISANELMDFLNSEITTCEHDRSNSFGDTHYEVAVDSRITALHYVRQYVLSKLHSKNEV